MQNAKLKTFNCSAHPSEAISRISKDPDSEKLLYCIECVLEGGSSKSSDLLTLSSLLEKLESLQNNNRGTKIGDKPPGSLCDFLSNKTDLVEKMSIHIAEQKDKALKAFDKIEEKVQELLTSTKNKIIYDLDKQSNLYGCALADYETKLSKYFNYGDFDEKQQNKEDVQTDLQRCETTLDFEVKIKHYLNQLAQSNQDQDETTILAGLKQEAQHLQCEKLPVSGVAKENLLEKIDQIIEDLKGNLEDFTDIEDGFGSGQQTAMITQQQLKNVKDHCKINSLEKKLSIKSSGQSKDFEKLSKLYNELLHDGILVLYEIEDKKFIGFYSKNGVKKDFYFEKTGSERKSFVPKKYPDGPPPHNLIISMDTQVLIHESCPIFSEIQMDPAMSSYLAQRKSIQKFCYNVDDNQMDINKEMALKAVFRVEVFKVK